MSVSIVATALRDTQRFFEQAPDIAEEAAVLAINDTVDREGMTLIKRDMRDQVNFPSGYLEGDRLKVTRRASARSLEAVIRGRDRPTSLARFAQGQTPDNTKGRSIRVQVGGKKNGKVVVMKRAFLMKLRGGNTGLAIRLPKGEEPRDSYGAVRIPSAGRSGTDLWLLYAPSVDQVFRGVADDNIDELAEMIFKKFNRQFGRLSRAR